MATTWYTDLDDANDKRIKDIIRTAVENETSDINTAAASLDEATSQLPQGYLGEMWRIFIQAAEKLSAEGPSQNKLVQIMSALRNGTEWHTAGWSNILSDASELGDAIQGMYPARTISAQTLFSSIVQ